MVAHNGEIDVFDPAYESEVKDEVRKALERNMRLDESYLVLPKDTSDEQIFYPYTGYRFTTNCEVDGIGFGFAFECWIEEGELCDRDAYVTCDYGAENNIRVNVESIEQAALASSDLIIRVIFGNLHPSYRSVSGSRFDMAETILFDEGDGYGSVSDEIAKAIVDIKKYEATKKIGD